MNKILIGLALVLAVAVPALAQSYPAAIFRYVVLNSFVVSDLKAVSVTGLSANWSLRTTGYTTTADGGAATYRFSALACSLNTGDGDNGSQIKPNSGTGCWLADFSGPSTTIQQWGGVAGANVDTPFDKAITWLCAQRGKTLEFPYVRGSEYLLATAHVLGNGSTTALSTCNNATIRVTNPQLEATSGTTPAMTKTFKWTGSAGVIPLTVQGPAVGLSVIGYSINCDGICSTGLKISNIMNARFDWISVERHVGPGVILTTENPNIWYGALEGSQFNDWMIVVPGAGGSGVQVGTTGTCTYAVIANVFTNWTINWDSTDANAYGVQLGCASQNTFVNLRSTYDPVRGGTSGVPIKIAVPTGTTEFPTDIVFIHPLTTGTVDPGPVAASWNPPTGGFQFVGWSSVYSAFPAATTYGLFTGTDTKGGVFPAPASWTPTDNSGAGLTFTVQDATYQKIGRQCLVTLSLTYPSTSDVSVASIGGFPCTTASGTNSRAGTGPSYTDQGTAWTFLMGTAVTTGSFYTYAGVGLTNLQFSGKAVRMSFVYQTN